MAKSTPASFDPPAEEKPSTKAPTTPQSAPPAEVSHATYPGQTLGIVALTLAFFLQIPALAMGIVAWVWSHKAGKNNIPAKVSVYVSAALIVIGTFFFAIWVALAGSFVGGFDHDDRGPIAVHIMPGQDGMIMPGQMEDMDDMMRGLEHDMDEMGGGHMMPTPSDLPSSEAVTN